MVKRFKRIYKSTDDLPFCMKVTDLAAVLNISRQKAYELVRTEDFPKLMVGTRIAIPKSAFLEWLLRQVDKNGQGESVCQRVGSTFTNGRMGDMKGGTLKE